MALKLILLSVYSLSFLLLANASTFCNYPDLQNYPAPHKFPAIKVDEFNLNCLVFPTFNATIIDSSLVVEGCVNAQYQIGRSSTWQHYSSSVPLKKGQNVFVKCEDSQPVLLVNPPRLEDVVPSKVHPSSNPSVFVVMIDAVAAEVLQRLMPSTLNMVETESDVDVFEFTKYATVGLNSNPNKFALFGRHDYETLRHLPNGLTGLTWMWEKAKELGYTTVIAEDECPRSDSVWKSMNVPFGDSVVENGPDFVMLDQMCVQDPHPNKYCIKGRWGYEYVVDYVSSMLHNLERSKNKKPIFMWSNFIDAHEPEQWAAALMDDLVVNYIRAIIQSKFMDNGVIVFLSDHGVHFGDFAYSSIRGSAENKHPFMYVMATKGLLNKEIVSANQDKLVTPSDLFRTLSTVIGSSQQFDPRDINIFTERVPEGRTCDMAGVPKDYCMCTYGPQCGAIQALPAHIWDICTSRYAHPNHFDWRFYNKAHLQPQFGRDFTECEATIHWCAHGFSLGLNGSSHDSLRAYTARTPLLKSHEFCWAWPTDCNWGHVAEHYFTYGFAVDEKKQ